VDEVAVFFAATDHGKSVTDLTAAEIGVRDDSQAPAAIQSAQLGEVAIYTVSTRDGEREEHSALLGDRALRDLADLTGGAAFDPGSISRLKGSLNDLQQVIRGRYLVSYKPASFRRNGQYRTIDIAAKKDGRKLKVYARKGYCASAATPPSSSDR
jgi:VWFA-related protein